MKLSGCNYHGPVTDYKYLFRSRRVLDYSFHNGIYRLYLLTTNLQNYDNKNYNYLDLMSTCNCHFKV